MDDKAVMGFIQQDVVVCQATFSICCGSGRSAHRMANSLCLLVKPILGGSICIAFAMKLGKFFLNGGYGHMLC
jgi:hypothetical protein